MKKRPIPHTYVIVFIIILVCAALTWVLPAGKYVPVTAPGGTSGAVYETVGRQPQTWQVFSALYEGFVDKADIVVFILIIGGAFWIVNSCKAIDAGILGFLSRVRRLERLPLLRRFGVDNLIIAGIMLVFSVFGAVFGMSEETIAFVIILVPLAVSLGYDSVVGICLVFVGAGLGFAGAVLNPFTIGIAQGLAGLPLFSGLEYRLFCWAVINAAGIAYVLRYARRVKRRPELSPVYREDAYWRAGLKEGQAGEAVHAGTKSAWFSFAFTCLCLGLFAMAYPLSTVTVGNARLENIPLLPVLAGAFVLTSVFALRRSVHAYLLVLLLFTVLYLIAGVMGYGWYVREISALFFALGIAAGWAYGYGPNRIASLFIEGCRDIFSAALVVGLAGGIIAVLREGQIVDTLLHGMAQTMEGTGKVATVGSMYLIQTFINLFIPSGSAKAALTMPILAPFSDLIGLSKQATVMAFQFGDGFTNLITPTSGVLIGVLGVARIPYDKWFRWAWKFVLLLFLLGFLLLVPTVVLPLNGF